MIFLNKGFYKYTCSFFCATGVQRYTLELYNRLQTELQPIAPKKPLHGIAGHIWEQFVLPTRLRGNLLFSPSNTGPLIEERQVVTIHDITPLEHPEWLNPRFAKWYQFLIPRLVHKHDGHCGF